MATIAPAALVRGAPRVPLTHGLLSVADMRTGDRWESGATWEALPCAPADGIGAAQCDPSTTVGLPKTLDGGNEVGTATAFTVYGHFRCSPIGWSFADAQARAADHLVAREEARVEQAFWTGDLGNTPALKGATPLAGGTAVGLSVALALLEDSISANYGSLGVIHLTRGTASQALGLHLLEVRGGQLTTALGTPVAAGAGYPGSGPTGAAAGANKAWGYASPAVFGYRSEVFTSSNTPGDLLDRGKNDLYAVAERTYLLGFDPCGVSAALIDFGAVSVSGLSGGGGSGASAQEVFVQGSQPSSSAPALWVKPTTTKSSGKTSISNQPATKSSGKAVAKKDAPAKGGADASE